MEGALFKKSKKTFHCEQEPFSEQELFSEKEGVKTMVQRLFSQARIFGIVTTIFLLAVSTYGQFIKLQGPTLRSERDIYLDSRQVRYSDLVKIKFKYPVVNTVRGQREFHFGDIPKEFSNVLQSLQLLQAKWGRFRMEKIYPDVLWGENLVTNKRTGEVSIGPDFSQAMRLKFERMVPIDSICAWFRLQPFIMWAEPPHQG